MAPVPVQLVSKQDASLQVTLFEVLSNTYNAAKLIVAVVVNVLKASQVDKSFLLCKEIVFHRSSLP